MNPLTPNVLQCPVRTPPEQKNKGRDKGKTKTEQ